MNEEKPRTKNTPVRPLHIKSLVSPELYDLISIAKKMLKNEPITPEEEARWKRSIREF
jgi:hypothetical protein